MEFEGKICEDYDYYFLDDMALVAQHFRARGYMASTVGRDVQVMRAFFGTRRRKILYN